jgi:hypothetical protein
MFEVSIFLVFKEVPFSSKCFIKLLLKNFIYKLNENEADGTTTFFLENKYTERRNGKILKKNECEQKGDLVRTLVILLSIFLTLSAYVASNSRNDWNFLNCLGICGKKLIN